IGQVRLTPYRRAKACCGEQEHQRDSASPFHRPVPLLRRERRAMTGAKKPPGAMAESPANSMWGGRFGGGPAEIMRRINASIDFDKRLYAEDIAGSKAHCAMLVAQDILSPQDGAAIAAGLDQIKVEIESGALFFSAEREDIH